MTLDLKMLQEFEDFLNMPQPGRDIEPMEVRDYRHEAYRKFEPLCRAIIAQDSMADALRHAIAVADEARDEWDAAPSGMRAGKLLIALSGNLPGYRADIDAIHAALAPAGDPQ